MTKIKLGIITVLVVGIGAMFWVTRQRADAAFRAANEALRQQEDQSRKLTVENQRLSNLLARGTSASAPTNTASPSGELLRLRGEVGRLRQENALEKAAAAAKTNGPSALSDLTANPGMKKLIRDQQKAGLSMIYKEFSKRANLPPEVAEKLGDLLADNVMENIDHITTGLREKRGPSEMETLFAGQDAALLKNVESLLGPEGFAQYQDYTRNLGSYLTAEQFKGMMTGEAEGKEAKSKQLYQLMQEETQRALAGAGLAADFQTVPSLNFRNFATESEAEKNLLLLDGIYASVAARTASFLSPEEMSKFVQFRTNAVNASRMALSLNRKLMAPPGAK